MVCHIKGSPKMQRAEMPAQSGTVKMKLLALSAPIREVAIKYMVVAKLVTTTLVKMRFHQNFGSGKVVNFPNVP